MEGQSTLAMIVTWLPLVVIFGVFYLWARASSRQYRKHVDEVNTVNQRIVDANLEMIAELREIKQILKDRN